MPFTLGRVLSESYISVIHGNGRALTLVRHLSPMNPPSGDILVAMSAH